MKYNVKTAAMLAAVLMFAPRAGAQSNFFPLLNCRNRAYTNATIDSVTPASATILWDGGGERIPITNLPPELLNRYHYDPQAAHDYLDAEAAKKAALKESADEESAALALAQGTLGPAQKIRIIKIISDFHLQIEAEGKVSEASIRKLPAEVLASFRELTQAKVDAARLEAQIKQDHQSAAPQPAPNMGNSRARRAAAQAQKNAAHAQKSTTDADTAALVKVNSRLKELESRTSILACPSDFVTSGGTRLWQFQAPATASVTAK